MIEHRTWKDKIQMKYAYKNGKILNGTKDMQVQEGLVILTDGEKIADIVSKETKRKKMPFKKGR